MNDQETDHVAQRQTPSIAHEELMPAVGIAKDIVAPERHEDSQRTDSEQGINTLILNEKEHAQDRSGDTAQTGGQTIDPVNQVDSVCHINHGENRDWHTQQGRDRIDPE